MTDGEESMGKVGRHHGRFRWLWKGKKNKQNDNVPHNSPSVQPGNGITEGANSRSADASEIWDRAYEELKKDANTKDLVETHEKIMSLQLDIIEERPAFGMGGPSRHTCDLEDIDNRFDKTSNVARQKCMLELAEDGLYLAQRSVATQERICTAGRFALSFKTAISSALELSPCASLAWVGLCSILPVVDNVLHQPLEHTILLKYIVDQAKWYSILATSLTENPPQATGLSDIRDQLKQKIGEIYKLVIKVNMYIVCRYYYRNSLDIKFRDSVRWEGWEEMYNAIKAAEDEYRYYYRRYYQTTGVTTIESLDMHLQQQNRRTRHRDITTKLSKYQTHQTNINPPGLLAGTGEWFFEVPEFISWSQWTSKRSLLLLKASAGCGKSVLASATAKRLQEEGCQTVCHFFFKRGSGNSTAEAALCTILHQLFSSHEDLLDRPINATDSVVEYMQKNMPGSVEGDVEILWNILDAATKDTEPGDIRIACILDALDECESGAVAFCRRLNLYLEHPQPKITFLITGRSTRVRSDGVDNDILLNRIILCSMIDIERIESNNGPDDGKYTWIRERDRLISEKRRQDMGRITEHQRKSILNLPGKG